MTALMVCAPAGAAVAPSMPPTLAATANAATDFLTSNIDCLSLVPVCLCKNRAVPRPTVAAGGPPLTSRFRPCARPCGSAANASCSALFKQFEDAVDGGRCHDVAEARPAAASRGDRHRIGLLDIADFLAGGVLERPLDRKLLGAIVDRRQCYDAGHGEGVAARLVDHHDLARAQRAAHAGEKLLVAIRGRAGDRRHHHF